MGGGGANTIEKSADPWKSQQAYLQDVFAQAQKQYQAPGPAYYPGQTVAGQQPATVAGQQQVLSAVPQQQATATNATNANNFLLNSYDVANNPALAHAIEAAQRPVIQAFSDAGGPLAQTRADAIAAGQYGGSRQGVAQGIAEGRLGQTLGDISSSMAADAYKAGLGASGQAVALAPGVQQTQVQPGITSDTVGQAQQNYEQQLINSAIQQWNYNQMLPEAKLQQYQNLVQGSFGGSGTEVSSGAKANVALGAVGGAAAAGGLAALLSVPSPYTYAIAGLGALLGAYGSR